MEDKFSVRETVYALYLCVQPHEAVKYYEIMEMN